MKNTLLLFSKFVLLGLIQFNSFAQEIKPNDPIHVSLTETKIISFKESITISLDQDVTWIISDNNGKHIQSGNGSLNAISFPEPGTFTVHFQSKMSPGNTECDHAHPTSDLIVEVSPYHLTFDFSTMQFSRPLQAGSLEGVNVSVECTYEHYENASSDLDALKVVGAGIGAEFSGSPINTLSLKPGKHLITYSLTGSVAANTFIMFDFFDLNKQVKTYYHPIQIK
jgi:hypothetical protein